MNNFIKLCSTDQEIKRNVNALSRRDLLAHDKAVSKLLDIICQQVLPAHVPAGTKLEFSWNIHTRHNCSTAMVCSLKIKDVSCREEFAHVYIGGANYSYSIAGLADKHTAEVASKITFLRDLLNGVSTNVWFDEVKTLSSSSLASCTTNFISISLKKHDTIESFLESLVCAGLDISGVL